MCVRQTEKGEREHAYLENKKRVSASFFDLSSSYSLKLGSFIEPGASPLLFVTVETFLSRKKTCRESIFKNQSPPFTYKLGQLQGRHEGKQERRMKSFLWDQRWALSRSGQRNGE